MTVRSAISLAGAALAGCIYPSLASATFVNYPNFSNTSGLTLTGSPTPTAPTTVDGTVLRLTTANTFQSGAAYSTTPVTLGTNATFSTQFQFRFTSAGGIDPADGITFVVAANSTGLGAAGGGLGYQGVGHSAAIEFDTYDNGESSSNHVGIDTNGALNDLDLTNPYGVAQCNFSPGSLNTAHGCMSNGDVWTALITYDGTVLNVTVQDGSGASDHVINDYAINIGSDLGTDTAFVGFTGATGSGFENQDILNWEFSNTATLPVSGVPEPASFALLCVALAAFAGFRLARRPTRIRENG